MIRPFAISVVGIASLACGTPRFPLSADHPLLGQQLPEIGRHITVFGTAFDSDELRGHPVFFKFFAEYCVPCKESLPAFQRLHQTHEEVRFVGIDEDPQMEDAVELAREFRLTFPVIADQNKVLSGRFKVSMLPTSFAVDASGTVRWVRTSRTSEKDLKRAVAALR